VGISVIAKADGTIVTNFTGFGVVVSGFGVGLSDCSVARLGLNVGEIVGASDSEPRLGLNVGEIVGASDSEPRLGLNVGDNDGEIMGASDSETIGFRAGLNVGDNDGESGSTLPSGL
jgi:hypothetical protein